MNGYLTDEWSPDAYRSLAHAAIADAFKVYVRAKKTLYVIEHPEDNNPLVAKFRASLEKKILRSERRREWLIEHRESLKGSLITWEMIRVDALRDIAETELFIHGEVFETYTDAAPEVFLRAAEIKLEMWKHDDGSSMYKPTVSARYNGGL